MKAQKWIWIAVATVAICPVAAYLVLAFNTESL
jgi:hypothetical protein